MINTFVSLISGSSGNASYISDGRTNILIDCGMSGKALKEALDKIDADPCDIDAILITHEHSDHVKGVGVVSRRYDIPIYATENTHAAMNIGKIREENIKIIKANTEFCINSIGIKSFSIPHDAADPVGYSFFMGEEKLSVATDIGHVSDIVRENVTGSKSVLLESNHNVEMLQYGAYPFLLKKRILSDRGHLSNENAAMLALELIKGGTEHIMLGHLSAENNTPDIARMTAEQILSSGGVSIGADATLCVASRHFMTSFGEF